MKKKILMCLCTVCFILPMAFILAGCQTTNQNNPITIPTDYKVTMEGENTIQHRITIINDSDHGTIYPKLDNGTSSVLVDEGDSYTVTIKAEDGFKVDYLLVNAEKVEAVEVYTLANISNDYTISAVFSEIIDRKHFITKVHMVGMIFDLSPTSEKQEIQSLKYVLSLGNTHGTGSSSSNKSGYVYCGKNSESKFTNSLNIETGTGFYISFNDSINYEITLDIDTSYNTILEYSFIPNKMDLEYVSDNIYMIKLDNVSKLGYNLENIVLYFTANFE